MTLAEFLEWEERQELRHEFDGFQTVAMIEGTVAHGIISTNLAALLVTRLRGKPCRAHGSNLKIEVMGSIRYPDAFVSCTPASPSSTVLTEPVVIFEALSRSTACIDCVTKNREYAATASVRRYVMLEQGEIAATMFERVGDDWVGNMLPAFAIIDMPESASNFPLRSFMRGWIFLRGPTRA